MCPKNIKDHEIKQILVIGGDSLIENLISAALARRVKDVFPHADIDIAAGADVAEFFRSGFFSSFIPVDKKQGLLNFIGGVRKKKYCLIISFYDQYLQFLVRGKHRLSFYWRDFFSEKVFTHECERLAGFLDEFTGKNENRDFFNFPVTKKDRERLETNIRELGIRNSDTVVVINPGYSPARKRWDYMNYADVAKELVKSHEAKIILTGRENDASVFSAIKSEAGNGVHILYSGASFREHLALLERADLLITQDVPYIYLACGVKCPVVGVFGPGNPYRYGPIGTKNLIARSNLDCFPCNFKTRCKKNYECLSKITSGHVAKCAMLLIQEREQPLLFDL